MSLGPPEPPSVAILGAGPAGLAAAEVAARGGACVTVYDRMPSPGRKFLLAGRGGLNLTHAEGFETFMERYAAASPALRPALQAFPPGALRSWAQDLGEPTFIGTSGRVFPRSFKASPLLRAWLQRLATLGVQLAPRHRWTGWTADGAIAFDTPDGARTVHADATVLALGGASWPRLGSDGSWTAILGAAGVAVAPLAPSNCAFLVDWSPSFRDRFEGQALKGVAVRFGSHSVRGDLIVTRAGLEGGPIYALSASLRDAIGRGGRATLHLALRPDLDEAGLRARLDRQPAKQSAATQLRKALKLSPVAIALVGDARRANPDTPLPALINSLPVTLVAPGPLAEAISTAGGVEWPELDADLMLRRRRGVFVAGEMLDWEAPTGGYLLQACFATGAAAGRGVLQYLETAGAAEGQF